MEGREDEKRQRGRYREQDVHSFLYKGEYFPSLGAVFYPLKNYFSPVINQTNENENITFSRKYLHPNSQANTLHMRHNTNIKSKQ